MTTYTYETIDPPGSIYTSAEGINSKGQIVGFLNDNTTNHGFLATDHPTHDHNTMLVGLDTSNFHL